MRPSLWAAVAFALVLTTGARAADSVVFRTGESIAQRNMRPAQIAAGKQWSNTSRTGFALFAVGEIADLATTEKALQNPNCSEANSLMRNRAARVIVKVLLVVGAYLLVEFSDGEYGWVLGAVGGLLVGVAVHNARQGC